jgi:hypothetical protein
MLTPVTSHQAVLAPLPLLLAPQWWALPSLATLLLLLLLAAMPQAGLYCWLHLQQPCLLLLPLELQALAHQQHQQHHLLLLLLPQGSQQ